MSKYDMKCLPGDEPRIEVSQEFIDKNKLSINTDAALAIMKENDFLGFGKEVALRVLEFETVKNYINENAVKDVENGKQEKWKVMTDVIEAAQDFLDYMVFAWSKAMDERGISAERSIEKLAAWMKILSRKDIAVILEDESLYYPYGKPALKKACEMLNISCPDYL